MIAACLSWLSRTCCPWKPMSSTSIKIVWRITGTSACLALSRAGLLISRNIYEVCLPLIQFYHICKVKHVIRSWLHVNCRIASPVVVLTLRISGGSVWRSFDDIVQFFIGGLLLSGVYFLTSITFLYSAFLYSANDCCTLLACVDVLMSVGQWPTQLAYFSCIPPLFLRMYNLG